MIGILIDSATGDLLVKGKSLAIGDNSSQVAECLLVANRGEFKEFPLLGGEVDKIRSGFVDPFWGGEVKKMLVACGIPAKRVSMNNEIITIE
jgi:hypothetical protein